ncbi:flagellar biosynthesis protein FlhF [Nitratiruptor sp. YY08-26]|uniref:flagellar biosynthesis protein FlhF n=1 Tax=unclassified Nitratiruptor TaxID=2624044 RepID=UPI00191549AB|nr:MULTISPECIES: flagellar biosynthesis protein FlhF [unclassified Nitratiruptor]BCD61855.1 flagellar biosynthesis protein FlhF [Nitratiruptor sp. YY08-13]BCD65790.1 flagellar biosynthesis protein FlhF [Nitratiruptor sp. YY08-26]
MEIVKYEGYNLDELIQQAKKEYGDEVKIISYEVSEKGLIPFLKKKKYSLFVQVPTPEEGFFDILAKEEKNQEVDRFLERIEKMIDKKIEPLKKAIVKGEVNFGEVPPHANVAAPLNFAEEFKEFTGDALELIKLLIKKDVDPKIAKLLVKESCGFDIDANKFDLNTSFFKEALVKAIEKKIKFKGPLKIQKGAFKVFAFVGPTGVGKTTNLFKIASELVINQKLKIAVISIDTFKVGAIQQARSFSNILNIPFYAITDSKNLKKTLQNLNGVDVVLIDTVGRSHYDYWRLGEMKEILGSGSDFMEISLVISCNYKNSEAMEIVNRYRTFFPISEIFFTKIDETYKPGILLNLPIKSNIPVSFISTGQKVPEDIRVLNPERIANYILGESV